MREWRNFIVGRAGQFVNTPRPAMKPETILWIYIVLLVIGGLIGFLKAKSKMSLINARTWLSALRCLQTFHCEFIAIASDLGNPRGHCWPIARGQSPGARCAHWFRQDNAGSANAPGSGTGGGQENRGAPTAPRRCPHCGRSRGLGA